MKLLNFKGVTTLLNNVVVEVIPPGDGSELGARDVREGVEKDAIHELGKNPAERYQQQGLKREYKHVCSSIESLHSFARALHRRYIVFNYVPFQSSSDVSGYTPAPLWDCPA